MSEVVSSPSLAEAVTSIAEFESFQEASRAVLQFLEQHTGLGSWMISRARENDWICLSAVDHHYQIETFSTLPWSDTLCRRMVDGLAPAATTDARQEPSFAAAPVHGQIDVPLAAYIGAPLHGADRELFGTLCGASPVPMPGIEQHLPLVNLLGRLLSLVLQRELAAVEALRKAERNGHEAATDPLTGLFNRRGLRALVSLEQQRSATYANTAYALSIDLNGLKTVNDHRGHAAGDELICRAAEALRKATRRSDIIARVGGDEFVCVAIDCGIAGAATLTGRIHDELQLRGVSAAIGGARQTLGGSIQDAMDLADAQMYEHKRSQRSIAA